MPMSDIGFFSPGSFLEEYALAAIGGIGSLNAILTQLLQSPANKQIPKSGIPAPAQIARPAGSDSDGDAGGS